MAETARPHTESSGSAATHIALLRGVNVGGKNVVAMRDLVALFTRAGCDDVRTYIQSGNILFCARAAVARSIAADASSQIKARFGLHVPVILRTRDEMERIVAGNPFLKGDIDPRALHVVFLADRPSAANVASLRCDRSPGDEFDLRGREIYLCLPNGAGRSKLTAAYFDSSLNTVSTQRNWRTATTLLEMMG
jgi:uncharacterized protein (DUF1697 family)